MRRQKSENNSRCYLTFCKFSRFPRNFLSFYTAIFKSTILFEPVYIYSKKIGYTNGYREKLFLFEPVYIYSKKIGYINGYRGKLNFRKEWIRRNKFRFLEVRQ